MSVGLPFVVRSRRLHFTFRLLKTTDDFGGAELHLTDEHDVSFTQKIAPPNVSPEISLSARWRLRTTSRGKLPLRLAFGTEFRIANRNGANSLIVC